MNFVLQKAARCTCQCWPSALTMDLSPGALFKKVFSSGFNLEGPALSNLYQFVLCMCVKKDGSFGMRQALALMVATYFFYLLYCTLYTYKIKINKLCTYGHVIYTHIYCSTYMGASNPLTKPFHAGYETTFLAE